MQRDKYVGMSLQHPNTPRLPPGRLAPLYAHLFLSQPGQSSYTAGPGGTCEAAGRLLFSLCWADTGHLVTFIM